MSLNNFYEDIKNRKINFKKYNNNYIINTKNTKSSRCFYHEEDDSMTLVSIDQDTQIYFNFIDLKNNKIIYTNFVGIFHNFNTIYDCKKIGDTVYFLVTNGYYGEACVCYVDYDRMESIPIELNSCGTKMNFFMYEKNKKLNLAVLKKNYLIFYKIEKNKFVFRKEINFSAEEDPVILNNKIIFQECIDESQKKYRVIKTFDRFGRNKYNEKVYFRILINADPIEDIENWLFEGDNININKYIKYFKKNKSYFYLFTKNKELYYFYEWKINKNTRYNNLEKREKIFYLVCIFKKMSLRILEKILYHI